MTTVHRGSEIINTPDLGDQVAFTAGFSYLTGFLIGLGRGVLKGMPKSPKLPRRLKVNNMFNSIGVETSKVGNAFGAAGVLYYLVGYSLNTFFEDYLDELPTFYKNVLCGATTGALFKSTLGVIPTVYGGVIGAVIAGTIHQMVDYGNRNGYVGFEMKF